MQAPCSFYKSNWAQSNLESKPPGSANWSLTHLSRTHGPMSSLPMPMNLAVNKGVMTLMGQPVRLDTASNKASVIDVIQIITGLPSNKASQALSRVLGQYGELAPKCGQLKFDGRGRETPVADAVTLLEIIWLCPGKTARVRRHSLQMFAWGRSVPKLSPPMRETQNYWLMPPGAAGGAARVRQGHLQADVWGPQPGGRD